MKIIPALLFLVVLMLAIGFFHYGRSFWYPYYVQVAGQRTVTEVIDAVGRQSEARLQSAFTQAGMNYPPEQLNLIALKDAKVLELWAHHGGQNKLIKTYPIKAASGKLGPKLREGDKQVPEGIYQIIGLNPNSAYHLSMKLNYPNAFDLSHAQAEGRTEPGSNIFIHGKAVSIGCLAMGDQAIEELFTLVHRVGRSHTRVIISPTDPANRNLLPPTGAADWVADLYAQIETAVADARSH